ncbi:Phenoloxidase 2 [Frankliniella fusca]|uniref:Phenoloxidase 2 n=1 Tax=Frankliniella fusca TaxID=407009 RepID=A0AAE1HBH2_9NEOP|nr:Phenoloxidase 2 [Frankliniella fusca]
MLWGVPVLLLLLQPEVSAQRQRASIDNLQYLFDRPAEPIFTVKEGDKSRKQVALDLPDEYLTDRQKELGTEVISRFGEKAERIPVQRINLPDLRFAARIGKRAPFSLFLPEHRQIAGKLIQVFLGMRNLEDFWSCASFARNHFNPYLFNYAYSVALLHRDDTKEAHLPPLSELFPDKYVDGSVFTEAREEANTAIDPQQRALESTKFSRQELYTNVEIRKKELHDTM